MKITLILAIGLFLGGCAGSFSCTFESDDEFMERIFKEIRYQEMSDAVSTEDGKERK